MVNLKTTYAGLELKNPLIIGSSSLTGKLSNLKKFDELGAGAVVLKSIFEEEILNEFQRIIKEVDHNNETDQHVDYYDKKLKQDTISEYLKLIKEAKASISIPVIASVNCISLHEWTYFVKKIEEAGADAIELNIFYFPADFKKSGKSIEKRYLKIIKKIKSEVSIPVIVKMSQSFTNLGKMIQKVSKTQVDGITLFNRFYRPDIDLESNELISAQVFSTPQEYVIPLQWTALMSNRIKTTLAASTGIHDGASFVKLLLAGASANYIVSSLYQNGFEVIPQILTYLEDYLKKNQFSSVKEIIGKLNQSSIEQPKYYERAQFMKYFSDRADVV